MKHLGIKGRLWGGFAIFVFLMMVLAGVAMQKINALSAGALDIFSHSMAGTNAVLAADGNMVRVHRGMKDVALAPTPEGVQKAVTAVDQFEKQMYADLQVAKKAAPELQASIEDAERLLRDWKVFRDNTIALSLDGKKEEAAVRTQKEGAAMVMAITKAMNQLKEKATQVGQTSFEETQGAAARAGSIFAALTGMGVVLAIGVGFLVARSITRPLNEAIHLSEVIASGDLRSEVNSRGNDEVARLLMAMKTMQGSLEAMVLQVRQGADAVANGSVEITQGNDDLSRRTEQQAASLEQTAASMAQLASTIRQNADNAHQANGLAQSASEIAVQGGSVVSEVVNTMRDINTSSQKISDIIGVIDGIAFQTNILALNAAVEAARAGEQGRGFAVVASEVRTLAQRSAQAAKEIKDLISASVNKVNEGTLLVDKAGQTMGQIVSSIHSVTDIMGQIASASQEQSEGVSQVGEAVRQMDQATQQNAALVEEMSAAAAGLSSQAQDLVHNVAIFKLHPSANDIMPGARRPTPAATARRVRPSMPAQPARALRTKAAAKVQSPAKPSLAAPRQQAQPAAEDEWETF